MRLKFSSPKPLKKSNYLFIFRGNYFVKDLTDILVEPAVMVSDFIYTKFVNTIVLIIPISSIEEFKYQYELWT